MVIGARRETQRDALAHLAIAAAELWHGGSEDRSCDKARENMRGAGHDRHAVGNKCSCHRQRRSRDRELRRRSQEVYGSAGRSWRFAGPWLSVWCCLANCATHQAIAYLSPNAPHGRVTAMLVDCSSALTGEIAKAGTGLGAASAYVERVVFAVRNWVAAATLRAGGSISKAQAKATTAIMAPVRRG